MLCQNCGSKIDDPNVGNCPNCNYPLKAPADSTESPTPEQVGVSGYRQNTPGLSWQCPNCQLWATDENENCPNCGQKRKAGKEAIVSPPGSVKGFFREYAQILGALVGLILAILVIYILGIVARPDTFLQKTFMPGPGLNAVPWTITFFFLWSWCLIIIRAFNLVREHRLMHSQAAKEVAALVGLGKVNQAMPVLEKRSRTLSFFNRIQHALYHWSISGDKNQVEGELRRQAELDIEASVGGFSLIRTFIWAMPIIGFIGTVIGISMAVGDFSNFLGGEIENIDLVKTQLMVVTNGLSFAFLTTLLGLLGALFVMLPASALQKAEEDFCIKLDTLAREIIIPFLKPAKIQVETVGGGGWDPEELEKMIRTAFKIILPVLTDIRTDIAELSETLKKQPTLEGVREDMKVLVKEIMEAYLKGLEKHGQETIKQQGEIYKQMLYEILAGFESKSGEIGSRIITEINRAGEGVSTDIRTAGAQNVGKIDLLGQTIISEVQNTGEDQVGMVNDAGNENLGKVNLAGNEHLDLINHTGKQHLDEIKEVGDQQKHRIDSAVSDFGKKMQDVGKDLTDKDKNIT